MLLFFANHVILETHIAFSILLLVLATQTGYMNKAIKILEQKKKQQQQQQKKDLVSAKIIIKA